MELTRVRILVPATIERVLELMQKMLVSGEDVDGRLVSAAKGLAEVDKSMRS